MPVVLVPLVVVAFSFLQQNEYKASAGVLLSSQNLAAQLTGTQSTGINLQPDRIAATQADVARVPEIARRVLAKVGRTGLTPDSFLARSSVTTATNTDILTFQVTNHDPSLAERLVNAYAFEYTIYRREIDTAAIKSALASVRSRIKGLADQRGAGASLYASLVDREQTLATIEALQTSNATVLQQANSVAQVQPRPKRNGALSLFLGLMLGVGLAFLWESLDTRVRSAAEIGEKLGGLPLLARVPTPSKKIRTKRRLVMLDEPTGTQAETFRMLCTNLDFVLLDRDVRTIMVTSAVEDEGKSTTIANLAIAMARAGRRVVLVDLDLRRPDLDRFFNIEGPGVTQVALGQASLHQALAPIAFADTQSGRRGADQASGNGGVPVTADANGTGYAKVAKGSLQVLVSGPIPPDPGAFVSTQALSEILAELRDRFDVVLIDAPPTLRVSDAMTLSQKVDGIIVVARMKVVQRAMLSELARQLDAMPTPVLGFVVTAAGTEQGYEYNYGYSTKPYMRSEPTERARTKA